jgi:hypothetical protein
MFHILIPALICIEKVASIAEKATRSYKTFQEAEKIKEQKERNRTRYVRKEDVYPNNK